MGRTEMPWTYMPYKDSSGTEVFVVCIPDRRHEMNMISSEQMRGQAGKTKGMAPHYSHTALSLPDHLYRHRHIHVTPLPLKHLDHLFLVPMFSALIFCHDIYSLSTNAK